MFSEKNEEEREVGMFLKDILHQGKGKWLPILGGLAGVLLILFGGVFSGDKKETRSASEEYYSVGFYTEALEKKIETLCTSIGGITEAQVLLTLDCSTEYVYARNLRQNGAGENLSYSTEYIIVNQNDNNSTELVMEIYPKIRGIAVVCTGGEDVQTKQKIVELLSAALGISSHRIKVEGT